jgi:hypothetical protein
VQLLPTGSFCQRQTQRDVGTVQAVRTVDSGVWVPPPVLHFTVGLHQGQPIAPYAHDLSPCASQITAYAPGQLHCYCCWLIQVRPELPLLPCCYCCCSWSAGACYSLVYRVLLRVLPAAVPSTPAAALQPPLLLLLLLLPTAAASLLLLLLHSC